jgi:LysM repeat protein
MVTGQISHFVCILEVCLCCRKRASLQVLPGETSLHARTRLLDSALILVALLGPLFLIIGFLARGLAVFYVDYARIILTYLLLAVSAGAATYLLFGRKKGTVRIIAGIAILANLGFIAYGGSLWSSDMRQRLQDATMAPMDSSKIGIMVAPADQGAIEIAEARTVEQEVRDLLRYTGLVGMIEVRQTYPISSEEQARHVGERLRANIVIWKTIQGEDPLVEQHHVTVLGAKEMDLELDPVSLMLLMATQRTVTVQTPRPAGEAAALSRSTSIVAPIAVGYGSLAFEQPLVAGAQFQHALEASGVPTATLQSLHECMGLSLLYAQRPDLAVQEFGRANQLGAGANAWLGQGIAALMEARWQDAQDAFNEARGIDPYDPAPYCGLGILAARDRNVSRAVSSYQQALALDPKACVPYALLGMAYELEAKIDAARQAYQTSAVQAGPNYGLYTAVSKRADEIVRNPPTAVPTATPIPIPTPSPVPTSAIYYVDRGDTLKAIAEEYGITIEALIEINQIEDANAIRVGQKLIIPKKR